MFKTISITLFLFTTICYSQLSNKHWLPPLHCRDAGSVADHYLYLSTQETTPLTIDLGFGQNTKMFVGQENVNI
uniref:hypothetical protein n=1 Tax=Flavobacterium sp. TaxID=239 RepID=UPI004048E94C